MTERQRWPQEIRERALELFVEFGPADAARLMAETGHAVPARTISSWASRAGVAVIADGKTGTATPAEARRNRVEAQRLTWEQRTLTIADGVADLVESALAHALAALDHGDVNAAKTAALTMAIAIDKVQLITGRATARTEAASEERITALVDELAARRRRRTG